ncbi:MAG: hypothetical protein Q7J35_16720 [Candidatus Methanoperedens sp.]|nr:hypothetical protein [Candidatus Methanoperedens sp.]
MMQSYRVGEVVLLKFPFADQQDVKKRPALVLLDADDDDILVERQLGILTQKDMSNVQATLKKMWENQFR